MALTYNSLEYYKKMLELQDKLRKSEEERIRLEERFKMLLQESRSRHSECINRLRQQYIEYLEEQRSRDERNHNLLEALDRVDNSLVLMSAKTDRLNVLRKQYEAYLLRVYANRPPGSVTGDSGIASQNEEKNPRATNQISQVNAIPVSKTVSPSALLNQVSLASRYNEPKNNLLNNVQTVQPALSRETLQPVYGQTNLKNQQVPQANIDSPRYRNELSQASHFPQYQQTSYRNYIPDTSPRGFQSSNLQIESTQPPLHTGPFDQRYVSEMNAFPRGMEQSTSFREFDRPTIMQSSLHRVTSAPNTAESQRIGDQFVLPNVGSVPRNTTETLGSSKLITPLPRATDYSSRIPRDFAAEDSCPLTQSELDNIIKRNEHILPKYLQQRDTRVPYSFSAISRQDLERERTTRTLENELDRYINKIKSMHRDMDLQSIDEIDHEQNTSGDLLNVTLSEDDLELPPESKLKDERLSAKVEKVLALADDLAARTAYPERIAEAYRKDKVESLRRTSTKQSFEDINAIDRNEDKANVDKDNGNQPGAEEDLRDKMMKHGQENVGIREKQHSAVVETSDHLPPDVNAGRETLTLQEKAGISCDVATHSSELEHIDRNIHGLGKQDLENAVSEPQLCNDGKQETGRYDTTAFSNGEDIGRHSPLKEVEEKAGNLLEGKQFELENNVFDIAKELQPWDMKDVERGIREIRLDDENATELEENAEGKSVNIIQDKSGQVSSDANVEMSPVDINEPSSTIKDSEAAGETDYVNLGEENVAKEQDQRIAEPLDDNVQEEGTERLNPDAGYESGILPEDSNAQYVSNVNQGDEYVPDPSQEYPDQEYNQNVTYADPESQEYQQYAEGQYAEGLGQQYEQYNTEEYQQYASDPNNQYELDPNAVYAQDQQYDPNQAYDENQKYDENQQYSYVYDQQQEGNENYNADPNQAYEYAGDPQYDPNQTYDNTEKQPLQEEEYTKEEEEGIVEKESKDEEQEVPEKTHEVSVKDEEVKEGAASADQEVEQEPESGGENSPPKKKKDVIKSLLESDTESTIERNASNTESDFDFN